MRTHLGGDPYFVVGEDLAAESGGGRQAWSQLVRAPHRRRLLFGSAMYLSPVVPYFAIFTFAPFVLAALHIQHEVVGTIALNAVVVVGTLAGTILIDRIGRRSPARRWASAAALLAVGRLTHASAAASSASPFSRSSIPPRAGLLALTACGAGTDARGGQEGDVPSTPAAVSVADPVVVTYDGELYVLDGNTLQVAADLPMPGFNRVNPAGTTAT